jgi:hypothetical protein
MKPAAQSMRTVKFCAVPFDETGVSHDAVIDISLIIQIFQYDSYFAYD